MGATTLSIENRAIPLRRGKILEYFTIGWNLLESMISISAGFIAESPSLVSFGSDSLIESSSGAALLWQLSGRESTTETREQFIEVIQSSVD